MRHLQTALLASLLLVSSAFAQAKPKAEVPGTFSQLLAFSADGKLAASADLKYKIQITRLDTGETLATLPGDYIDSILFSADNSKVTTSSSSYLCTYEVAGGKELSKIKMPDNTGTLFFFPNTPDLALRNIGGGKPRTAVLFDVSKLAPTAAKPIPLSSGLNAEFNLISLSADHKRLAIGLRTANLDPAAPTVLVADVATGDLLFTNRPARGWGTAAISPDGKQVALWIRDDSPKAPSVLQLWDIDKKAMTKEILLGNNFAGNDIAYCSDGKAVVTRSSSELRIINLSTGKFASTAIPQDYAPSNFNSIISPEHNFLGYATFKRALVLWDFPKAP